MMRSKHALRPVPGGLGVAVGGRVRAALGEFLAKVTLAEWVLETFPAAGAYGRQASSSGCPTCRCGACRCRGECRALGSEEVDMSIAQTDATTVRKPLRLWPGVVAAVVLCVVRFVIPAVFPRATLFGMMGGVVCVVAIVVWWLFFSRAPWSERLGAVALAVVALVATSRIIHVSVATGMMGMMFPFYAIMVVPPAFVAGVVAGRRLPDGPRRAVMAAAILLACGGLALLRTDGVSGGAGAQLAWRWTKTPEQVLLAQPSDDPAPLRAAPAAAAARTPREGLAAGSGA